MERRAEQRGWAARRGARCATRPGGDLRAPSRRDRGCKATRHPQAETARRAASARRPARRAPYSGNPKAAAGPPQNTTEASSPERLLKPTPRAERRGCAERRGRAVRRSARRISRTHKDLGTPFERNNCSLLTWGPHAENARPAASARPILRAHGDMLGPFNAQPRPPRAQGTHQTQNYAPNGEGAPRGAARAVFQEPVNACRAASNHRGHIQFARRPQADAARQRASTRRAAPIRRSQGHVGLL